MTPERWKQIEELYHSAVDSAEEARAALFAQASPEIRDTVLEMLAQQSAGNILDRPAWEGGGEFLNQGAALVAAGTQLGPYRIERILGSGGMGAVYRAFDSRLSREVAVKILPPAVAEDPERLRRFEQEARAAGTLNHPNVLTIYDVGTHDGTSYLVSELLEGETLRDRLRAGALPRGKALEYARWIAAGLTAAHERGITHRDLKPENLFITRDGRLKILDFGLAKFTGSATAVTTLSDGIKVDTKALASQPGVILGTVGYMSPEQVQAGAVDHRSDLFNLGLILYEMLTGQRAFQGATAIETLHAILKEDPRLSDEDPKLGPDLTRVLRHCLEKDPRDRFQSAKDLAFDIEALGLSHPIVRPRPSRGRLNIAVAVASVLSVILVLIGREIGRKQPVPSFRQITFRSGNITGGRFARDSDGQTIVYSAAWEGKPVQSFLARAGSPESRPLLAQSAGVLAISAGGELALMLGCELNWGECRGTIARMPLAGGAPREVLQNSDSADWDTHGELAVVRPVDGRFRVEYPIGKVLYENATGWISHLRFSPKGDRIAFLDHPRLGNNDGSVEVVDLAGHKTTLAGDRKGLKGMAWSPSGDELWFSGSSMTRSPVLSAVTLSGKERVVLQTPGWAEIMDIAPDGRVLLLRQNPRTNIIYRSPGVSNGRSLSWFDWSTSADLSPDGKTLLFYEWGEAAGGVPIVYKRDTEGGEAVRLGEGKALALSLDQKWVLALKAGTPPQLNLLPTGAGESRVMPQSGIQDYYSGAWFPDGQRILFAGERSDHIPRSFVQDVAGGEARAVTMEGLRATLISPDGKWFAAYGPGADYSLVPADGGKSRLIRGTEFDDELIQWSEDGRFLFVRGSDESVVKLFRIDLLSGRREPWKTLEVPDNVGFIGLETGPGATRVTPDGKSSIYTFWQARGELYIAEGLK